MKNKILKNIIKNLLKEEKYGHLDEKEENFNLDEQFSDIYGTQHGVKDPISEETFKRKSKLLMEKWNKLTFID